MVKKLSFSIIFLSFCMLFLAGAAAADTISGTIITAEGYENYIDYNDIAGNPKATVYGPTLEATVLAIYGLSGPGTPSDQTTDPNVAVYYSYSITNQGNTTDVYSLSLGSISYGGAGNGAGYWTIQIVKASDDTVISSLTIAEDASASFRVKVTPSSSAKSGYTATVPVTASTAGTPAGAYTGANGNSYGGPASVNDTTITEVEAPTLTLTRVATVDAPPAFNQNSDNHYPVPGAVVTITMTYSNEGTASAESCIILDRVPSGHQMGHVNGTVVGATAPITLTAPQGDATGWTVSYTTEASLTSGQQQYGNTTGWILLGTLEAGSESWTKDSSPSIPLTAAYVKWEKASIDKTEDGKKLSWGYIIR